MHSDQMRTNAMSKSMIQVLYCRAVSCCEMYCIGYSLFDNLVCSLFVHVGVLCCFALFVCLTLLASYIRNGSTTTLHDNIGLVSWI